MFIQSEENQPQEFPPIGQPVIVQCDGYRCMAYRSPNGQWFSVHDGREVVNVIKFYPMHYPPV